MNGEITTSISIGDQDSFGENTQEHPEVTKETLPPKLDLTEPYSKVNMSLGFTKSIGNFEFLRCDIGAEDFCSPNEKQQAWISLEEEITKRMSVVIDNIEKIRNTRQILKDTGGVEVSESDVKKAEGDASEDKRRAINKELVRLAKFSKIKYSYAVNKIRETELTEEFCDQLLQQLQNNDVSFFLGKENGDDGCENDDLKDNLEDK